MNRTKILSTLNIRPGEGWLVSLMLIYAFFMGIPALVTETAAYSLFLETYSAQYIPYIYIGFAIVTTFSGFVYTALEKRVSFFRFASINLMILALTPVGFRLLLEVSHGFWPLAGLAIWYETSWALASLGFWSVAVYMFDLRQGKRLFALVGIGLTLSEAVAGFLVPGFVRLVGTANLLLVSSASFVGALLVQTYILRRHAHPGQPAGEEESENTPRKSFVNLFKNNYIVLIFALAGLYAISFYALDNAFYDQVETRYTNADQLASFLGVFFGLSGLLTLVLGAFVSGKLISYYGLRFGLLAMPVIILVGVSLTAVVGTFTELLLVLFVLVVATKFINEVLAYTINRAAWQVLYEPLPESQRLRAQTVVESIIKPVSGGLAGLLLLGFNLVVEFNTVYIAYLLIGVLVGWIGVVVWINRLYPAVLLQALAKRRLSDTAIDIDRSHLGIFKKGLLSPHVNVVIYSLNMLEEIEPASMPLFLADLLTHTAPEIRQTALERIERFKVTSLLPPIRDLANTDPAERVRGAALRTLAVLGGPVVYNEVHGYLNNPLLQVRAGAMVGLLRQAEQAHQSAPALEQELAGWVESPEMAQRILAAQVLGQAEIKRFHGLLLKLLYDDKLEVREAALLAAKKLRDPAIWGAVIDNLDAPRVRASAIAALVAGGQPVLRQLDSAIGLAHHDHDTLARLIGICGRIRGPEAIEILTRYRDYPDVQVRTHVLQALAQCAYQAPSPDRPAIIRQIKAEAARATWILGAMVALEYDAALSLVETALKNELTQYRTRLFLLLSFIYPAQTILSARNKLGVDDTALSELWDQQKAYALEIIDVTLEAELKPVVLPLLDNLTPRQRLAQLKQLYPQAALTPARYLADIITTAEAWISPWTKAAAIDAAARLSATDLTPAVAGAVNAPNSLVRETARFALQQLNPALYASLAGNGNPPAEGTLASPAQPKEEKTMLSLVERVILLKSVSIFSETPEDVLAAVAAVLEEMQAQAGEIIIEKGNVGSSLYIIIDGEVKVFDEARTITTLSEGEVFGEFSLLDPGPRTASVAALEETRLFRLDQDAFLELIDDHSTIARKIMQVLVRYLRNAHFQMESLSYRKQAKKSSG